MACRYSLDWLDSLINDALNPSKLKSDADVKTPDQIQCIKLKIEEEKHKYQNYLDNEVFRLLEEDKIEVLINQYYSRLIFLYYQVWQRKTGILLRNSLFKEIHLVLIHSLEELISFIEIRFASYLNLNQTASIAHLLVLKKELKIVDMLLRPELEKKVGDKPLTNIVFNILDTILSTTKKYTPMTLGEVTYIKELVEKLKDFSGQDYTMCNAAGLNELLIYLNFNSLDYIHYFTQTINAKITSHPDVTDQLDNLLLYRKEFNQKHIKTNIALDNNEKDLRTLIGNWFNQEILYLENKQRLSIRPLQERITGTEKRPEEVQKISCALSVDQLSLFLRSAADLQIIKARSLNTIFKQIVPYLSTPSKADISWDSMRSKSYAAEKRDKEILVQTLERMVKKVREY